MKTTYYSGIDLHKRTSYIATVNQKGDTVKEANLKNHPLAITRYFAELEGEHKAVVESTFNWYWLADLLEHQNIELTLAHAKYLKAITYAKVKTDKVDANTLAQLLRMEMIPEAHQISSQLRGPRDLLRTCAWSSDASRPPMPPRCFVPNSMSQTYSSFRRPFNYKPTASCSKSI